jgi:hypothetical protein
VPDAPLGGTPSGIGGLARELIYEALLLKHYLATDVAEAFKFVFHWISFIGGWLIYSRLQVI